MKVHSFFVGCLLALVLNCWILKIHCSIDETHELILNNLKLAGSADNNKRDGNIYSLSIKSATLLIKFPQNEDPPKYNHCYAYVNIPFTEATYEPGRASDLKKTFIVFDCSSHSCNSTIEASFFQTRMLGAPHLNLWNEKLVEFQATCELAGSRVGIYTKEIHWRAKMRVELSGSIPGAPDSEMQTYMLENEVLKTEAKTRYIITPLDLINPSTPLLFSHEVQYESCELPNSVHMGPGYLRAHENVISVTREMDCNFKFLTTYLYSLDKNPEIFARSGKQQISTPGLNSNPIPTRDQGQDFFPFTSEQPIPPNKLKRFNPNLNRYPGQPNDQQVLFQPINMYVDEEFDQICVPPPDLNLNNDQVLSDPHLNHKNHPPQVTKNTVQSSFGISDSSLDSAQEQSETASSNTFVSVPNQILPSKEGPKHGKKRNFSGNKLQIKSVIKMDSNNCCSSQLHASSNAKCECKQKPTSFKKLDSKEIKSVKNAKSAASKLWIPFASIGLCFLYFF